MSFKFSPFNAVDAVYKTVHELPLKATILAPKASVSGKCPLLVHFHGGGLMVGDKMFGDWFPLWLAQYAEKKSAIIVTPDYRLIPEATGGEIMDDIQDFWTWVHKSLNTEVSKSSPGISVDLDRIAVAGESAGGYLSIQSALLFPEARIKVVMSQYGTMDVEHPSYNAEGVAVPEESSFVSKYMKKLSPTSVRLSSPPPVDWDLCMAILNEGRHRELIGTDERVYMRRAVQKAKNPPPMWLANGDKDPIIPVETAEYFMDIMKKYHPETLIHWTLEPGGHGFDTTSTVDDAWVKKGSRWWAREYKNQLI